MAKIEIIGKIRQFQDYFTVRPIKAGALKPDNLKNDYIPTENTFKDLFETLGNRYRFYKYDVTYNTNQDQYGNTISPTDLKQEVMTYVDVNSEKNNIVNIGSVAIIGQKYTGLDSWKTFIEKVYVNVTGSNGSLNDWNLLSDEVFYTTNQNDNDRFAKYVVRQYIANKPIKISSLDGLYPELQLTDFNNTTASIWNTPIEIGHYTIANGNAIIPYIAASSVVWEFIKNNNTTNILKAPLIKLNGYSLFNHVYGLSGFDIEIVSGNLTIDNLFVSNSINQSFYNIGELKSIVANTLLIKNSNINIGKLSGSFGLINFQNATVSIKNISNLFNELNIQDSEFNFKSLSNVNNIQEFICTNSTLNYNTIAIKPIAVSINNSFLNGKMNSTFNYEGYSSTEITNSFINVKNLTITNNLSVTNSEISILNKISLSTGYIVFNKCNKINFDLLEYRSINNFDFDITSSSIKGKIDINFIDHLSVVNSSIDSENIIIVSNYCNFLKSYLNNNNLISINNDINNEVIIENCFLKTKTLILSGDYKSINSSIVISDKIFPVNIEYVDSYLNYTIPIIEVEVEVDDIFNEWKYAKYREIKEIANDPLVSWFDVNGKGLVGGIFQGWGICNGNTHAHLSPIPDTITPDLRERFKVGVGVNPIVAGPSYAFGDVGGVNEVTLTALQSGLRNHSHVYKTVRGGDKRSGSGNEDAAEWQADGNSANTQGLVALPAQDAHENRPPYFAVLNIIKLNSYI